MPPSSNPRGSISRTHHRPTLGLIFVLGLSLGACSSIDQQQALTTSGPPLLADTSPAVSSAESQPSVVADNAIEPELPADLLSRMSRSFHWEIQSDTPQVKRWIDYYLNQPDEFAIVLDRSAPYLHYIAEQISERDMPMELALLPFVESGFDPRAKSRSGAAGLWQFMPSTGRALGLEQNWWVDERLSVQGSTQSALDYLEYLRSRFGGDWLLALAAYNTGEGNVANEIRRTRSDADFWSLHLNVETRNYVPRLLAVVQLIKDAERYQIELPAWADEPYFETLPVANQLDMRKLQAMSAELSALNAQYVQSITYPQQGTVLLVPRNERARLQNELATNADQLRAQYARYQVRNGDNLSLIADRHRVNLQVLMSINNLHSHLIHPGDNLLIPVAAATAPTVAMTTQGLLRIRVRSGDTLSVIAERYGMGLSDLLAMNNLDRRNPIYPNQELVVRVPAAGQDPLMYQVSSGDSLWVIANRFNVGVDDLLTWNGLHGRETIYPGQELAIWMN